MLKLKWRTGTKRRQSVFSDTTSQQDTHTMSADHLGSTLKTLQHYSIEPFNKISFGLRFKVQKIGMIAENAVVTITTIIN